MCEVYDKDFSDAKLANLAKLQILSDVNFQESDAALVSSLENQLQYEGRRLTTNMDVPGNIHKQKFRNFWLDMLKAPEFVLKTLEEGYKLPFHTLSPESFEKNNASARAYMTFVREEVRRLEALGLIKRVKHRPMCVLPLSSVFSKKKHLVVDMSRCLNLYLLHRRVSLQDHCVFPELVKPGCFMATNNFDSGYWYLRVKPDHWN